MTLAEIAPRPHNTGHYTIEACALSQYDAHLRAILDLPIPPTSLQLRSPAIMLNILGGDDPDSHLRVAERALSIPGASVHLYGKGAARPARKMGHVTVTAPSMGEAQHAMQPLVDFADAARGKHSDGAVDGGKTRAPLPLVAVVMGSDSDLPTMEAGLKIFAQFDIPVTVRVTSGSF